MEGIRMNIICRIFGYSYRWCGGIVYCHRCGSTSEFHKRYMAIKAPLNRHKKSTDKPCQ